LERNIVPGSIKYVDLETYLTKSRANSKKKKEHNSSGRRPEDVFF